VKAPDLQVAAPLIYLVGEESGGFNLDGPSSSGKPTLILAGGSLESDQNRQAGAAYEALAQRRKILTQQLGSRLGNQDVRLVPDMTNQPSLALRRYLSPPLYVSYAVAPTVWPPPGPRKTSTSSAFSPVSTANR